MRCAMRCPLAVIVPSLMFAVLDPVASAADVRLTGEWSCDDQGTYRISQFGSSKIVWWSGRSEDDGRSWTNVFRGRLEEDNTLHGDWVDVHGTIGGRGHLVLHLTIADGKVVGMRKIKQIGNEFGGRNWSPTLLSTGDARRKGGPRGGSTLIPAPGPLSTRDFWLTGEWSCNDLGIYWIRQIDDYVWWSGKSLEHGKRRENVYKGTISGDRIRGQWVDVQGMTREWDDLELELIIVDARAVQIREVKREGVEFEGRIWEPKSMEIKNAPRTDDTLKEAYTSYSKREAAYAEGDRKAGDRANEAFWATLQSIADRLPSVTPEMGKNPERFTELTLNRHKARVDALRFKTPMGQGNWDMDWEFIMPGGAGQIRWYIGARNMPMTVGFERFDFEDNYREQGVSLPSPNRRVIQPLHGGALKPGEEYLIWFAFEHDKPVNLNVRIGLSPAEAE